MLTGDTIEEMLEPVLLNDARPSQCGLGYMIRDDDTQPFKTARHSGSNFGWQAFMIGVPERNRGLAILTNSDNGGRIISELLCKWMKAELEFEPANCR